MMRCDHCNELLEPSDPDVICTQDSSQIALHHACIVPFAVSDTHHLETALRYLMALLETALEDQLDTKQPGVVRDLAEGVSDLSHGMFLNTSRRVKYQEEKP